MNKASGSDPTLALIGANALTLAFALALDWSAGMLLWPYFLQNLVIGWYATKRMGALRRFSTEGFTSNDQPVPENREGKRSTVNFFVLHFGLFHLFYLVFLCAMAPFRGMLDFLLILAGGVSFVFAQRKTCAAQIEADAQGRPNLGAMMFMPYMRVLPIHIAIAFGAIALGTAGTIGFVVLKTLADIGLDRIDRRIAEQAIADA
ncbi:DUF6498-containing protein [Arenimonas sp.]|uniref:DUF6498-containing protein n=1 Tax=Arenimonas sp. TaxID=1872635 RepID=UPI0039E50ACB